jgi:hypothetical protein
MVCVVVVANLAVGYRPRTVLREGVRRFIERFREYCGGAAWAAAPTEGLAHRVAKLGEVDGHDDR